MSFLSSAGAYCSSLFNFQRQTPQYCHGTTFSTLYMMGKQTGDDAHCLVPFGQLAKKNIPCFAGECFRGLMDGGHNYTYSSWTSLEGSKVAESYSKHFLFDPQKIKKKFQEIITDCDRESSDRMVPYSIETHTAYWNQMILQLRQYRAWDEESFQHDLEPGLQRWIGRVIKYFEANGQKHFVEEAFTPALEKMKKLQKEISNPPIFQAEPQDKEHILNAYPVVFITSISLPDSYLSGEYLFSRKMKLGRDIQWIATDLPHVEELQEYLRQKNLTRRVSVISFETLKEMREHPPVQESLGQRIATHFKTYGKAYVAGAAIIAAIGIAKMQFAAQPSV